MRPQLVSTVSSITLAYFIEWEFKRHDAVSILNYKVYKVEQIFMRHDRQSTERYLLQVAAVAASYCESACDALSSSLRPCSVGKRCTVVVHMDATADHGLLATAVASTPIAATVLP